MIIRQRVVGIADRYQIVFYSINLPSILVILICGSLFSIPVMNANATELALLSPQLVDTALSEKNPEAQYLLGWRYYFGESVGKDISNAKKWFTLSADQGYAKAQFLLGMIYLSSPDGRANEKIALQYLQQAAAQGHSAAQYELANSYVQGVGGKKQFDKAATLYQKAAEQNHIGATAKLGELYYKGIGVKADFGLAFKYLSIASQDGDPDAKALLDEMERIQQLPIGLKMLDMLPNSEKEFAPLRQKVSEGDINATYLLSLSYFYGRGVSKDAEKSAKWLRRAAGKDHVDAQYLLGVYYEQGIGVPQDTKKAEYWLGAAADWGNTSAIVALQELASPSKAATVNKATNKKNGSFIRTSLSSGNKRKKTSANNDLISDVLGVQGNNTSAKSKENHSKNAAYQSDFRDEDFHSIVNKYLIGLRYLEHGKSRKDIGIGLKWLQRAAEKGYVDAQIRLADEYYSGSVVKRDYKKSAQWYSMAAENGDAESQYMLGLIYRDGLVGKVDNALSLKWFRLAANRGFKDARDVLGGCKVC